MQRSRASQSHMVVLMLHARPADVERWASATCNLVSLRACSIYLCLPWLLALAPSSSPFILYSPLHTSSFASLPALRSVPTLLLSAYLCHAHQCFSLLASYFTYLQLSWPDSRLLSIEACWESSAIKMAFRQ